MNVGILILTDDASKYRVGDYVEGEGVICQPTGDHITYICNVKKITEKELRRWMPLISYRMVFVVPKLPKLSKQIKDEIIIDGFKDKSQSYKREIDALFRWDGRGRVLKMVEDLPIPLALAFVKVNNDDIGLQRRIADIKYQLPDKYLRATLVYGIKPFRSQVTWPKRKASPPERPEQFRESDEYWEQIVEVSKKVRNQIRTETPEQIPSNMKKRKESEDEVRWR